MEIIIKMTQDEAVEAIEKGSLLGLLQSMEPQHCTKTSCSCQDALAEAPKEELGALAPRQQPDPPAAVPVTPVAITAMTYQLDDLAQAAMGLMRQGMQTQLQELLRKFGVEALPQLPAEQYGAFATALREMGAQI